MTCSFWLQFILGLLASALSIKKEVVVWLQESTISLAISCNNLQFCESILHSVLSTVFLIY
jgi:hypothetical protein